MKLQRAIIDGKFCGLNTVEECYLNASRFLMQIFPWDKVPEEDAELLCEMAAYEAGYLGIDWEYIDNEVERINEEFEEYHKKNPPQDLNIPEEWRKG